MARLSPAAGLPTIWTVPDGLWREDILPILRRHDLEPPTGRPRIDQRRAFNGIMFILRSGCRWNRLPAEFGNDSSVHRTFQRWVRRGVFQRLWAALVAYARRLGLGGLRLAGRRLRDGQRVFPGGDAGQNPTDRAKPGTKRSILTEGNGWLIAAHIAAANVRDSRLLQDALDAVVVTLPNPCRHRQHLCLDKEYDNPTGEMAALVFGYIPHIRRIGEQKLDARGGKTRPARRSVAERGLSWWNGCRSILVRWAKTSSNYLAFIELDSALLSYRRIKLRSHGLG